jgi:dTMP kinase
MNDYMIAGLVLVTISGVDLAGKTTQLDALERWLADEGVSMTRLWYRPGYSSALNRVRDAVRALRPSALPPPGPSKERDRVFARPGVQGAWITMAIVDSIAQYALRVRAALARHEVVLCDRYIDDAVFDFELRFPQVPAGSLRRVLRAVSPRPDLAVLLVLPWDEVMRRLTLKDEPFPDPIEQRRKRYQGYQQLAASGDYLVVDATRSVESIQEELRGRIREARR